MEKCVPPCKYHKRFVGAAGPDGPKSSRIFVTNRNTKVKFLINNGADVSVYPKSRVKSASIYVNMSYTQQTVHALKRTRLLLSL